MNIRHHLSLVPQAKGGPFRLLGRPRVTGFAQQRPRLASMPWKSFRPSAAELNHIGPRSPRSASGTGIERSRRSARAAVGCKMEAPPHRPDADVRRRARDFVAAIIDLAGRFNAPAILGSMQGRWGDGVTSRAGARWLGEGARRSRRPRRGARRSAPLRAAQPLRDEPLQPHRRRRRVPPRPPHAGT